LFEPVNKSNYPSNAQPLTMPDIVNNSDKQGKQKLIDNLKEIGIIGLANVAGDAIVATEKVGNWLKSIFGGGKEAKEATKSIDDFFSGTKYSQKVIKQMEMNDFHSFPESVKAFQKDGIVTTIKGKDGITRQVLRIPGSYKGKNGYFEFIKESDGTINHRYFQPIKESK